jgi:hypothetical protein
MFYETYLLFFLKIFCKIKSFPNEKFVFETEFFNFCKLMKKSMKNLRHLLLLMFCTTVSTLFSQEIPEETMLTEPRPRIKLTHQIDVNMNSLFEKFLKDTVEIRNPQNPFVFGYTVFYKNFGLRGGIGWRSSENLNEGGTNNNAPIIVGTSQKDFRAGFVYQYFISPRWRANFMADGIYGVGDNTLRSFFTDAFGNTQNGKIAQFSTRYGVGAGVGIQYFFNSKIGLGTEFQGVWRREKIEQKNDFYLPIGVKPTETKQNVDLAPPTVLYLFVRF